MMVSRGLRDPITPPMIILSIQALFQSHVRDGTQMAPGGPQRVMGRC